MYDEMLSWVIRFDLKKLPTNASADEVSPVVLLLPKSKWTALRVDFSAQPQTNEAHPKTNDTVLMMCIREKMMRCVAVLDRSCGGPRAQRTLPN